jgi:hypothetical protein
VKSLPNKDTQEINVQKANSITVRIFFANLTVGG